MSRLQHNRDRAAAWRSRQAPGAAAAVAAVPAGPDPAAASLIAALTSLVIPNAARTSRDPVLGAFDRTSTTYTQAGSLTGITPTVLGGYLTEFYDGTYANIAKIWERMERADDGCRPARNKRLTKTLCEVRNYTIDPVDDSPEAQRQAEFLAGFYKRLRTQNALVPAIRGGVLLAASYALDAVPKQFAFLARSWSGKGENLTLTLRYVPLWFFRQEYGQFYFCPNSLNLEGEAVDPAQWIVAAQPSGVMEAAGVAVSLKRLPLHQLIHILEKWGVPSIYGKTSAEKDSPSWEALYAALQAMVSGWTGVISGDAEIDTIEPKVMGMSGGSVHLPTIDRFDQVITTLFLGSHLGTKAQGDTGALAGGAQADDTDDLIAEDCDWLTELFHEQIDRDALAYGLDVDEPLAGFHVSKPKKQDDAGDMERLEKAVDLGVDDIPVSYVHKRYGFPSGNGKEPVLARKIAPVPGFGPGPAGKPGSDPATPKNAGASCDHPHEGPFRPGDGHEFAPFPGPHRPGGPGHPGRDCRADRRHGLCSPPAGSLEPDGRR